MANPRETRMNVFVMALLFGTYFLLRRTALRGSYKQDEEKTTND